MMLEILLAIAGGWPLVILGLSLLVSYQALTRAAELWVSDPDEARRGLSRAAWWALVLISVIALNTARH